MKHLEIYENYFSNQINEKVSQSEIRDKAKSIEITNETIKDIVGILFCLDKGKWSSDRISKIYHDEYNGYAYLDMVNLINELYNTGRIKKSLEELENDYYN